VYENEFSWIPVEVQARIGVEMNIQARTIAVIDDDPRVLESLLNFLASCGYKAETYLSAEQFLGSGGLSRCMCIIADIEMRQMSGLALLQHIRSSDHAVPVVIITGKPFKHSETFYIERGAIGFFRKPVDCDALVDLIGSVCSRSDPD
jgi:FixJ family two-component response regulator